MQITGEKSNYYDNIIDLFDCSARQAANIKFAETCKCCL